MVDCAQWAYTSDTVQLWGKCISVNHLAKYLAENWSRRLDGNRENKAKQIWRERERECADPAYDPGFDGERDRGGKRRDRT